MKQNSISDRGHSESLHHVYFCTSLCWKKVFMVHSALLQYGWSRWFG